MDLSNPLANLLTENDAAVLRVLSRLEAPVSGRQVHKLAEPASYSGIRLALDRLSSSGVVSVTALANAHLYSINRDHLLWRPIEQVLDSRLRLVRRVREHLGLSSDFTDSATTLSVSFFGSVGRGDSSAASDIDLAVIYESDSQKTDMKPLVDALVDRVESWTANAVQVYDITRDEFRAMILSGDPLVNEWVVDNLMIAGPSIPALYQDARR